MRWAKSRLARIAVAGTAAASVMTSFAVTATPASANTCCIIVNEDQNSTTDQFMLKDVWGNNTPYDVVPQSAGNPTTFAEILPADFGGNTYFLYQDSRNYCIAAIAPPPHEPSPIYAEPCDSNNSAQRWRWVAVGSWHYLTNLHFGQNMATMDEVSSCELNGSCSYVVLDPGQLPWGVFSV